MTLSPEFYKSLFLHDTLFKITDEFNAADRTKTTLPSELQKAEKPETNAKNPNETLPLPPVDAPPAEVFPALSHQVLIIVNDQLKPSELQLLHNILKAIGHTLETVDLLEFNKLSTSDARQVLSEKKTRCFLTFGVPLTELQIDLLLPPYTPQQIEGIWFLLAEPLSVVEPDVAIKKRLWAALQQMFPKK